MPPTNPKSPELLGRHATPLRGLANTPSSAMFEGRFGRLFRNLSPAQFEPDDLVALAAEMVSEPEEDKPLGVPDEDENTKIPAGYTYLGQFIDHDLTFDPVSSLERDNDPDALVDFRTPRFDLDCLYGRGPSDQPYMYEMDGRRLITGLGVSNDKNFAGPDLPRAANHRAIIGDPRNDENKLVSQLHSLMIRFHNKIAETTDLPFGEVQRTVRYHYQWIVLHDFLPKIVGRPLVESILNVRDDVVGTDPQGKPIHARCAHPDLRIYNPRNEAFIPIEFSVAAYRFGHSMVRPSYLINDLVPPPPEHKRIPIFSGGSSTSNMSGFDILPRDWGLQWGFFFPLRSDPKFAQPSYKIDEEIADPLGNLPPSVASRPASLAERNLKRGVALRLPSGQDVARALGLSVLSDDQLFEDVGLRARFRGKAPLWYYILRESNVVAGAAQLGPVGARIVAETFIGVMWKDSHSRLRQSPAWRPTLKADGTAPGTFTMPDLIKFAGAAI
jgi:hypothetical protein